MFLRWDALLSKADSENKITSQNPYHKDVMNLHYRLRLPEEVFKQAVPVRDMLTAMTGHWLLHLRTMYRDPIHGGTQAGTWWGVTSPWQAPGRGSICLGTDMIMPLLKEDLMV